MAAPTLIDHKGFDFCMKSWISWDLEMCKGPTKGTSWLAFLPVPGRFQPVPEQPQVPAKGSLGRTSVRGRAPQEATRA